jgi:hypothetical protein
MPAVPSEPASPKAAMSAQGAGPVKAFFTYHVVNWAFVPDSHV